MWKSISSSWDSQNIQCCRILMQRDRTLRLYAKKRFYLCWHWLSRFTSEGWALNRVGHCLIYRPLVFPLILVPLSPLKCHIPSVNSSWMVYVTKLHMDTDYVMLPQSYTSAHRCWLCHIAFSLFWEGPYHISPFDTWTPPLGQRASTWFRGLHFHSIITCVTIFLSTMASMRLETDHVSRGVRQGKM